MSLYGSFALGRNFDELNDPIMAQGVVTTPAQRQAAALVNLGLTASAAEINAAADLSGNTEQVVVGGGAVTPNSGGGTYLIPAVTANVTMTLPATPTLGEKHTLRYIGGVADAEDWVITAAAFFAGGVAWLDIPVALVGVFSNGTTHNTLTINNPTAGTVIDFIGNGTNWTVSGTVVSTDTPAFSAV